MLGLIKNDFYASRKTLLVYCIATLIFICTYIYIKKFLFSIQMEDNSFTLIAIPGTILLFIMEFFYKCFDICKYYFAMPISASKYVLSKYVQATIFGITGFIMGSLCITLQLLTDNVKLTTKPYENLLIALLIIFIFLFIQMPILMYTLSEVVSFLIPFGTIAAIIGIAVLIKGPTVLIEKLINFYTTHSLLSDYIIVWLSLALCVVFGISFAISKKICERKEF